jgi:hypothetical protein
MRGRGLHRSGAATVAQTHRNCGGAGGGADTVDRAVHRALQQTLRHAAAYDGYSTYDMVHIVAEAAARAGTTEPDKMVIALEETDHAGTIGREQFYGREHEFTHALNMDPGW